MIEIMTSCGRIFCRRTILLNKNICRERYRSAKPEGQESPGQLIVRIRNYFVSRVFRSGQDVLRRGRVDVSRTVHQFVLDGCVDFLEGAEI